MHVLADHDLPGLGLPLDARSGVYTVAVNIPIFCLHDLDHMDTDTDRAFVASGGF